MCDDTSGGLVVYIPYPNGEKLKKKKKSPGLNEVKCLLSGDLTSFNNSLQEENGNLAV